MTRARALQKIEKAKVKHEKKWGTGSAKIEPLPNAIVLAAHFLSYLQDLKKRRYGLPLPHDIRPDDTGWVVRYAVRFKSPKPGQ